MDQNLKRYLIGLASLYLIYRRADEESMSNVANMLPMMPMGSRNMSRKEKKIQKLLDQSRSAYQQGAPVNDIVKPFAKAQRMIHSKGFKKSYEQNPSEPIRAQLVQDFAQLGNELSS